MNRLHPNTRRYLRYFNQLPNFYEMEPQEVRSLLSQPAPSDELPEPLKKIDQQMIPVENNDSIMVRIYTPTGNGPFPVFLYMHGGGWVFGDINSTDETCRLLAYLTNTVVVSVNYRLAPEYKFPIPVNDSYTALNWVFENYSMLNGIQSQIIVGGNSAGATLATAVSMMAKDFNGPHISAQVLIYPVTNLLSNTSSYNEFEMGYGLDKALMEWFIKHYIRNSRDKNNKLASPLLAEDLTNLPPAFIAVAENDILRDEAIAYAIRLKEADVSTKLICKKGLIHGYFTNLSVFSEEIKSTIMSINDFLKNL